VVATVEYFPSHKYSLKCNTLLVELYHPTTPC